MKQCLHFKFKFILDYLTSQPVIYILIKLNGRKKATTISRFGLSALYERYLTIIDLIDFCFKGGNRLFIFA